MPLMGMSNFDLAERILARSIPVPESGCWLWEGTITKKGYGRLSVKDSTCAAHRVSYVAFAGPIPDGLFVCHKCDVPGCVNPKHLFLGTHSDNMIDSVRKKRHRSSRKKTCPRGHPYDRASSNGIRECSLCDKAYREEHKDYFRQKIAEWNARNPQLRKDRNRVWSAANREKRRQSSKAYRLRNLEKRRAECREYYYRKKAERLSRLGL
jgi:hypothetical protein